MTSDVIIKELQAVSEWFKEHGRNTNTAIIGICERAMDYINRQEAEIERLEKGSLKEAMCFNSNTIKRCSDAAVKDFAKKLKKEIEDECASIRLNNSAYYAVNLRLIDDLVEEFTEGAQMNNDVKLAVAEAIKEFAKELVDKSTGGQSR